MTRHNDLRSREALLEDRMARVASYKVQGLSIRQTIVQLTKDKCLNPDTKKPWSTRAIHDDVVKLTARWQASALRDISQAKADELAKLDELEREAWAAWRRGIGRKQSRTTKTGGKEGDTVSVKTEVLNGDPRYLAVIDNCIARRCEILGLKAPTKLEASGPGGGPIPVAGRPDLTRLTEEELGQLGLLLEKGIPA